MTTSSTGDSVVERSSEPDYSAVELPSKDRTAYTYVERRAEILQLAREAGTLDVLNQTQLADRYGVSQQQISKDYARIRQYARNRLSDRDRRAMYVDSVVRRSIRGLLDDEEYRKAAKTAMEYDGWVTEFHDLEVLHERVSELQQQERFK